MILWFYFLLAIVAGIMMPTQAAVNTRLSAYVQSPVLAAFISFVVGSLALLIYLLMTGIPLSQLALAKGAPMISWTGGLLGAFFVTAVVLVVPHLGVALTFSLLILGQMLATLPIDHFGFQGVPVKEINIPRIMGIVFVIIGVILLRRF